MSNKQSSIEWLFNQIKKSSKQKDNINNDHLFFYRILEQAKEMHKQEIEEAELKGKEIIIIKHTEHGGGNNEQ